MTVQPGFMSDLVGTPNSWFPHAHALLYYEERLDRDILRTTVQIYEEVYLINFFQQIMHQSDSGDSAGLKCQVISKPK